MIARDTPVRAHDHSQRIRRRRVSPCLAAQPRVADRLRAGHRAGRSCLGARRLRRDCARGAAAGCARAAQPRPARRRAGPRVPQADPSGGGVSGGAQQGLSPDAGGRRHRGAPHGERGHTRCAGAGRRFRRPRGQRLAGGQPVHRHREPAHAARRHRSLSQRPPAGRHRAEESHRRGRDDLDGVAATADVQGGAAVALRVQRAARGVGRPRGPHRNAHGR